MKFSLPEITAMLNNIGITNNRDKGRMIDNLGIIYAGHPTLNISELGEYIDSNGGQDCSMEEYLSEHSKYPIEKWKFYLGMVND